MPNRLSLFCSEHFASQVRGTFFEGALSVCEGCEVESMTDSAEKVQQPCIFLPHLRSIRPRSRQCCTAAAALAKAVRWARALTAIS